MADNDSSDLLMAVTLKGKSTAEKGEAKSAIDTSDSMMVGMFNAAAAAHGSAADVNLFCQIKDITFGIGVEDDESAGKSDQSKVDNAIHAKMTEIAKQDPEGPMGKLLNLKGGSKSKKFKNFVDYGQVTDANNNAAYSSVFDEITISRNIDQLSIKLLDACLKQTPLKQIVVVKRKFTGNQKFYHAYVRWEFSDCLISAIDWDHDELVSEKMKFVYRTLSVQYKPQKTDGTLGRAQEMNFSLAMKST